MSWVISGGIVLAFEVVDTESGNRRNVCIEVPATDIPFAETVEPRWRKSFEELAWIAANNERKA